MAQPACMWRSLLVWVFPLLMAGACTGCPAGSMQRPVFERPAFMNDGLLALSSDYYVVRASEGDTYMGLAWEHNVSPYDVISLNEVKAPYRLEPGELVRIPAPRIHVVLRGETLSGIAEAYHVDFYDLAQANALNSPYTIFPGQVLRLPSSGLVFKSRRPRVRASSPPLPKPKEQEKPERIEEPAVIVQAVEEEFIEEEVTEEEVIEEEIIAPEAVEEEAFEPEAVEPGTAGSETIEAETAESKAARAPAPEVVQLAVLPRPKPRSVAATAAEADTVPAEDAEGLLWPVRGRIISGFGPTPNGRHNDGINIAVPESTPVRAAADGVVIYTGNEVGGFGNLVLVRHEGELVTAYAHASEIKVKKGERVRKGQPIALSGSTGNVEMPQLHFEVRRGVTAVDPVEHLSA